MSLPHQVTAYSNVFWKRVDVLTESDKIKKNIERGEQKIQRQSDIMAAISHKLEKYKNPWQDVKVREGRQLT